PRLNHHVLCDALLESGHWLAEPLALWMHRPSGSPRMAWAHESARALVLACPGLFGEYVLQGADSFLLDKDWIDRAFAWFAALYTPTLDGREVAAFIDAECRKFFGGRSLYFTLSLRNDETWLVGFPSIDVDGQDTGTLGRRVLALPTGLDRQRGQLERR